MKISVKGKTGVIISNRIQAVKSGLPLLLLRYIRPINFVLLAAGLLIGVYLVITLLFIEPELGAENAVHAPSLANEALDTMELWIEERQDTLKAGLQLPVRPVFTTNGDSQ